jgi:hypothetical protein
MNNNEEEAKKVGEKVAFTRVGGKCGVPTRHVDLEHITHVVQRAGEQLHKPCVVATSVIAHTRTHARTHTHARLCGRVEPSQVLTVQLHSGGIGC